MAGVLLVIVAVVIIGISGNSGGLLTNFPINGNTSGMVSAEESFDQYQHLHEGINSVEGKYINDGGFVDEDDVPQLIEDVGTYVHDLPNDLVASYDVGEGFVQVDLTAGFVYVYSPPREHMMNRGDGMAIGSYEQETEAFSEDRDYVIEQFDLKAKPDDVGVLGNSLMDTIAWYMASSDSNQFHLDEFYDDEDVTLDVIKNFHGNKLILWEGHGLWTDQLGPQLQLSQKIDTSWWSQLWGEDFRERRLVVCGDHIAVTCAFFSHYYEAGALQDSIIYLGPCYSLRDDRLASILNAKGASLIIGNTNPVSSFYQYEMRDSILADMADYRMSISQALKDAKAIYGDEDPWCAENEHTKVAYYPKNAGSVTLYGAGEEQIPKGEDGKRRTNYEYFATNLVNDMYDDWTFSGGREARNSNPFPGRCLRYIDRSAQLYSDFIEAGTNTAAKYAKDTASCVIGEPKAELIGEKTCRVTIDYVSTQGSVNEEEYDRLLKGVRTDVWIVAMNDSCKAIGLERESAATQGSSNERASRSESTDNSTTASDSNSVSEITQVKSRDIAMVLDVSGSMAGDPMDATKNAASRFVDVALDNGAQTALVAYDDKAEVLSDFTTNEAYLQTAIGGLRDGGSTDIEKGLATARSLLMKNRADRQFIVLMSDGQPNSGKTGGELVSYAESIRDPDGDGRDDVIVYTLGFNESGDGEKLLRDIASEGCYISVHDAGDLEYFFQYMVDSINGVKFMYARVACPVDVSVTFDGETLDSAGINPKTRTSFGSLTFEEDESGTSDDPVKVLRLREGQSYDIAIEGTGFGTMDYSIGFIDDEGIYSDFRTFSGIDITDQTAISTTAEATEATTLAVDEDGDGTVDKTYRASANQEGELVDNSLIVRAIVAGFAVLGLVVAGALLWRALRGHQARADERRALR